MKTQALVEKDFKLRFGLRICLLTIAGVLAVTIFLRFVTSRSLGGSYAEAIYTIYDLKIKIFPLIFASFYSILVLAVVTASIAAISIFFSHKIAGPIFRIEKTLEALGSGDLTVNTRFRGNDQLAVLAEEINGAVRSLNYLARRHMAALAEVERCEDRIEGLLRKGAPAEDQLKEAFAALLRSVEELKRVTAGD